MASYLIYELFIIRVIQVTSLKYKCGHLLLFATKIADPRNAFLIFFPMSYICSKSLGITVLWTAVFSEWINLILKWLLHGDRPYWTSIPDESPDLKDIAKLIQLPPTCETGPGNPSGHLMVPSAVIYCIIKLGIFYKTKPSRWKQLIVWGSYILFLFIVCCSRIFIATHFPHQVILGAIIGFCIGKLTCRINHHLIKSSFTTYLCCSILLCVIAGFVYFILENVFHVDPFWSQKLAADHCEKKEWLHMDTSLFFSLSRDCAALAGLGCALAFLKSNPKEKEFSTGKTLILWLLTVIPLQYQEGYKFPPDSVLRSGNTVLFYVLAVVKWFFIPLFIVFIRYFVSDNHSTNIHKKIK